jgi:hypothetical protein
MNGEPDFWVPYGGGHLPMVIIGMEVSTEGGPYGEARSVEMTIRAISCGAPVYTGGQPSPAPRAIDQPNRSVES